MWKSWIYEEYKDLLSREQLPRFQIADMQWFKGAGTILELVDQLHTKVTSKNEFIELAEKLNIEINPAAKKEIIAELVKSNQDWRIKAFEMDNQRRLNPPTLPD